MTVKTVKPAKIILISIDTLRADHLGCYGYVRPTSPNIDRLAGDGQMFPYAFSPSSYTVPVHTSLLTGLYPANHGIGFSQKTAERLDPDANLLIQEILRDRGYLTGAFVSSFVLRKEWGLNHGFDIYDDSMTGSEANRPDQLVRDGRETNKAALGWIRENKGEDFFVWLHYFDVHGPYTTKAGIAEPFKPEDYGDSPVLINMVRDGQPGGIPEYQLLDVKKDEGGDVLDYQKDVRHYLAGYDNGIIYQDMVIGQLLDGLKFEGLYEEAMIIVTADHGEALGENGVYFFHGLTVTPEQSRVPLIIKLPDGFEKKIACNSPVSTVDITPTILDYVGFPFERLSLDGISLANPDPSRFILSENEWQRAVIWKDLYLLQEKNAVFDGFYYYFDSQNLCRGLRIVDYKSGKDIDPEPLGPSGEILKLAEFLGNLIDPKERRIKDKDRVIAEKDGVIAEMRNTLDAMGRDISARREVLVRLERELESVYSSNSWRFTYPVRWVSARLKGLSD